MNKKLWDTVFILIALAGMWLLAARNSFITAQSAIASAKMQLQDDLKREASPDEMTIDRTELDAHVAYYNNLFHKTPQKWVAKWMHISEM